MIRLLTDDLWDTLRPHALSATKAYVAVAYLGTDACHLLPLPSSATLVVDASDGALKSGQTSPQEIAAYIKCGVRVYSHAGLHAKVYVLGDAAFVGLANVSRNSRDWLEEAMVLTDDETVVRAARGYVRALALERITPGDVKRMAALYRPPVRGAAPRRTGRAAPARHTPLWVSACSRVDLEPAEEELLRGAEEAARALLADPQRSEADCIRWTRPNRLTEHVKAGDEIVLLFGTARRVSVLGPYRVLSVARYGREGTAFAGHVAVWYERQ